jgi:hypothetical protein
MFDHRGLNGRHPRRLVGFLLLLPLVAAALGFGVMALWNGLLPPLFGLKPIHFWQALGLLVLSRLLFGGFHRRSGPPSFRHRQRLIQRWESMTPEERERFKQGFRGRFCGNRETGRT